MMMAMMMLAMMINDDANNYGNIDYANSDDANSDDANNDAIKNSEQIYLLTMLLSDLITYNETSFRVIINCGYFNIKESVSCCNHTVTPNFKD